MAYATFFATLKFPTLAISIANTFRFKELNSSGFFTYVQFPALQQSLQYDLYDL